MFIIAQIIGLIALMALVLSFQKNNKKTLLKYQIISNFLYALQYLLLSAMSGFFISIVCAIRNILYSYYQEKTPKIYLIIVLITITFLSLLSYTTPISILPGLACFIFSIALYQKDLSITRKIEVIACILYIIYNIRVKAISGLICILIELTSTLIAIYKFDIKPKK